MTQPTVGDRAAAPLLERHREQVALEQVLADARAGTGTSLVLRGAAGSGRTALLEYAVGHAADMRLARLAGIESELGLGFAALHRLLAPFLADLHRLPVPQRDALRAAFGLVTADPPDRFLVGLAGLTLLAGAAAEQPLLLAVDDAHWLDEPTAEVLGFMARRLATEPIGFVVTVREPTDRCRPLEGLPARDLAALPDRYARQLLATVAAGPVPDPVAARLVAESRGNPRALIEYGQQMTDRQLGAGGLVPHPLPISGGLTRQLSRGLDTLPAGTRQMLLLVAAEGTGERAVVRRAADLLGLGLDVAGLAEAAGVLTTVDRTTTFGHPLVRSAVYHGAHPHERRRAHAALAAVVPDPDTRAWHLAAAAGDPDEATADELAQCAARAGDRGDRAMESALLAAAAGLTPDPRRRADRLLDGASAALAAGAPRQAAALLDQADPAATSHPARAVHLRAAIGLAGDRLSESPAALLDAARALRAEEPVAARRALLDALFAALLAGRSAHATTVLSIVHAAREWAVSDGAAPTAADLLLDGFATRVVDGYGVAVPVLRRAVAALLAEPVGPEPTAAVPVLGYWAAGELMDGAARRTLVDRWAGTAASTEEPADPRAVLGHRPDLLALAGRGAEAVTRSAVAEHLRRAGEYGAGSGVATGRHALAILDLGLGRYEAALASALTVYADDPPDTGTHILPDLVEAAVRAGNLGAARSAADRLAERARTSGTPLAAGLLARSRALLATGTEAETGYQEAVDQLRQAADPGQLARTHLLYGEWLRRQRRRRDAREQLRTAHDLFGVLGSAGFAQRARSELLATGERATSRIGDVDDQLTPQERQVARLVTEGSSNRQVAAQLFISPSTVEYHLQKVFRKVGVSSRTQLARTLLDPTHRATVPVPAGNR
jgi:DNA-binding CsgD family transcriptional regulator